MKNQLQKTPHIGKMLKKYIMENKVFQAAWARQQNVNSKTIAKYFKKETMQVSTLFTISQVLKYNFIHDVAGKLPVELPPHTPNPLEAEIAALKKEIEMLKREIEIWKEAAGVKK
ncbi:MAG: hypothetical protein ACHQNT_02365 [Bacteroidia bacterium]